jgi:hypothetical protein
MKVVINTCYGGFSLKDKALRLYSVYKYGKDLVVTEPNYSYIDNDGTIINEFEIDRDDPYLVRVVEELGEESHGSCTELLIKEIPDGAEWEIEEHDGKEYLRKPAIYY